MKFLFTPRFTRLYKKRLPEEQDDIDTAVSRLGRYLMEDERPLGLGVRHLRGKAWELRIGLKLRVIFSIAKDTATFLLIGNHDDVTTYIKSSL